MSERELRTRKGNSMDTMTKRRRRRVGRSLAATTLGLLSSIAACAYDSNDRCGEGMELYSGRCVCPPGSILVEGACSECGEHEVAAGTACVCEAGYERPGTDGDCEPVADGTGGAGGEAGAANTGAPEEQPPEGLGMSCSSNADCEGTEAEFCDTFMTQACQVIGCSLEPDDCYMGYECCDLSAFSIGNLCVPVGACMP
jgi:hypothetical protein